MLDTELVALNVTVLSTVPFQRIMIGKSPETIQNKKLVCSHWSRVQQQDMKLRKRPSARRNLVCAPNEIFNFCAFYKTKE